ncbi:MAG: hypothetical protein AUK44_06130 [Porphyromonadaceae bacterium CG2_30_38_12]|nr:MAG: hypothetical protein AUK44_06130 [Porphyromonadaceae bacterium CG2_30_38_12]
MKQRIPFIKITENKLLWISLIAVSISIKIILLPVEKADYITFLEPWMNFIRTHNYEKSLKFLFFDYAPAYIYILILITKTGLNSLFLLKIVSIFFEYLAAYFIGKFAQLKIKNEWVVWASISILPLLPTVMLNASYLSQCDAIYTSLILGSVYYLLLKKQLLSILFLGLAFSFKLQTAIVLPFFFVMMVRGNIKWYLFIAIPIIYILSILPAVYFGGSFKNLSMVYVAQANQYRFLTQNFPNLYIFIDNNYYDFVKPLGILITALYTIGIGFWLRSKKNIFNLDLWVKLLFLSSITVPFLLPGMHERYMFLGDMVGLLYLFVIRKNIYLPICILLISTYSYARCSRYNELMPMWPAFIIFTLIVLLTHRDFVLSLKQSQNDVL